jgi:bifunctional ADP-heptose synthase (sugar kinase/adenylyltransferase)
MKGAVRQKILDFDMLLERVRQLRAQGKSIVQTHGVFDLIHPGLVHHFAEARSKGDVLVATVIRDRHVRRGPGRPLFPEALRVDTVAALESVDLTSLVDDIPPFESVRLLEPDVYAKGKMYAESDRSIHEEVFVKDGAGCFDPHTRIVETSGFTPMSSSQITKSLFVLFPDQTKQFLSRFVQDHSFAQIADHLNRVRKLKVLLVGDGIIDEYHYCEAMGRSAKSPLVVYRHLSQETFAGGVFNIANHLSGICDDVSMVSLLGRQCSHEDFIRENLRPNVRPQFFYREDAPTIVKRRSINQYNNQKVFETNYLNDHGLDEKAEDAVVDYLREVAPRHDLVLFSDFGHGFLTKKMFEAVRGLGPTVAVNSQTNGANIGFNLITKYRGPEFVCLDEVEARLATQQRHAPIERVITDLAKILRCRYLIITLGKRGSLGLGDNGQLCRTPVFSTQVVDTIGAGDAFFAFTAPCFAVGMPADLLCFLGNAVGALAVQIVGNRAPVEKHDLLEFIYNLMH